MKTRNHPDHYAPALVALHWLMLILIASTYACIELRVLYDKGTDPREALKMWHFMLGLCVLVLVSSRLVIRTLAGSAPFIEPPLKPWQTWSSRAMHGALYALMLGMPIAGWLILSASGKPVPFFGLTLPPLVAENKELAKQVKELHETAGTAGYVLIGLHALAGLFHHHVRRDNTLQRMLPGRRRVFR